jgi:hypothetical protein
MDPLTASLTLATLVQLIGEYKQEHKEAKDLDHQKFIEWLQYHRHEEIKNLICNTAAMQAEVDKLLRQDHAAILEKLDGIGVGLATLLGRVDEFKGLASIIAPSSQLSEQAADILRQFVKSGSSYFTILKMRAGVFLHLENGGYINYSQPEYLPDDLEKLVSQEYLLKNYTNSGGDIYRITRKAADFVAGKPS